MCCSSPLRLERDASFFPSGAHLGQVSDFSENVNCRAVPLFLSYSQIWRMRFSPFKGSETTNATRETSGQNCGSLTLPSSRKLSRLRNFFLSASGVAADCAGFSCPHKQPGALSVN